MVNREPPTRYMIPDGMEFSPEQNHGIEGFIPKNPRTATNKSSVPSPWSQEVNNEVAAWLRVNAHKLEGPVWSFEEKGGDGIPTRPIRVDEIDHTFSGGQEEPDPEEAIKLAEQKGLLSKFIQTCTPREKNIFQESMYKSQAQIAREMGLSRGRVHALVGKVVRKAVMSAWANGYVSDDSARHEPGRVKPTFGANGESSHIASKQIRGNSLEYLMNSFERIKFSDVQAKLAVMQTKSCTAAVNAMKSTGGIHDLDPYEQYRQAVREATADLSKLRMFRLLLTGPETMWTDRSPVVHHVRLLRQNPNSAIPTVNAALQKISEIQSDTFTIPSDYAKVLGANVQALLTQITGYSTLTEDTKGLDGKECNGDFGHLAHQIDFVLDMIPTVYRLGVEWGSKLNSKSKALIDECRKCHDVLTAAREKKDPTALQDQIIHVANEISKLFNTAHTGIEGGSESFVSRRYMTREELDKARASAHMMRLPKLDLSLPPKAQVVSLSGGNIAQALKSDYLMVSAVPTSNSTSQRADSSETIPIHKSTERFSRNEINEGEFMNFLTGQRNASVASLLRYLSTLNPDEKLYPDKMNGEERTTRANQISVELDTLRRMQSILLLQNKALWSDITSDKSPSQNVHAVSEHVTRLLNPDQKVDDFIKSLSTIKDIPLEIKSPPHSTITAGVKSVLQQLIQHPHIHMDLYNNHCSCKVYADDSSRPIGILPRYDIFGSQVLRVLQCVEDAYWLSDELSARQNRVSGILQTQPHEMQSMRQNIRTWILELKEHCNPNKWHRTDSNAATRKSVEHTMALEDSERSKEKTRQGLLRGVLNDIFGNRSSDGSLVSDTGIHRYKNLIRLLHQ